MRRLTCLFALMILSACVIAIAGSTAAQTENQSVYTDVSGRKCRTIRESTEGAGYWTAECSGVNGYKLLVDEDDLRQNVTVVTPLGKKHDLNLWSVIGTGFSNLGEKAEWRMAKQQGKLTPIAVIVRFTVSIDAADSSKTMSYLAVSKITSKEICVTDKIPPSRTANEEARRAADSSANKPCLQAP